MSPRSAQELIDLVREGRVAEFLEQAEDLMPADLADVLAVANEDERVEIVKLLPPLLSGQALWELPQQEHPEDTLAALEPERAADIVEELADDDAADLLGELEPEEQRLILSKVEDVEQREEVAELLLYDRESAGGLMTGQMVTVLAVATVAQALDEIRRQADHVEDFAEAYVVDDEGRLQGVLTFKTLVLAAPDRLVAEVMEQPEAIVAPKTDQEEVARLMARYNVASIPVVDRERRLLGRITFDDVTDVVEAEATEDLLKFGGVSGDEDLGAEWKEAVRSRRRWLLVNLVTAAGGASVVGMLQGNIRQVLELAIWMPIVGGLGGNTGTQALAVTIRRLSLGLISPGEYRHVVGKEMLVGLANGVVIGALAGTIASLVTILTGSDPLIGVVVFLALVGNLVLAGTIGAFVPLVLQRFGVDPAIASSVFVTAFTDMCGFTLLLGLAGWVLL